MWARAKLLTVFKLLSFSEIISLGVSEVVGRFYIS